MNNIIYAILLVFLIISCKKKSHHLDNDIEVIAEIHQAKSEVKIDGNGEEVAWVNATWRDMDQLWDGSLPTKEDFSGRYKVLWSDKMLYVLAEIQDDKIIDTYEDGLEKYWDDDCLELFIDEDNSGGDHQYNHSAFAYHIATNLRVTDIGRDGNPLYLDHHLQSGKVTNDSNLTTWEVGMRIYQEDGVFTPNTRILRKGDLIGFSIAYCDNDGSAEREHFMGSNPIPGVDKNRAWIDAGLFKKWKLVD